MIIQDNLQRITNTSVYSNGVDSGNLTSKVDLEISSQIPDYKSGKVGLLQSNGDFLFRASKEGMK